jgi:dephospho-CoA kinase
VEVAVGISGRIGSGKSTLATELADRMNCPRASFGDYVRSVVTDRGLNPAQRPILQAVGDELITGGWDPFCRAILERARYDGGSVVVEGIRHIEAAQAMEKLLAPTRWRLIAVDAQESTRVARLPARGMGDIEVSMADAHPTESQIGLVIASADLVVSGETTVVASANVVMEWLATTS